MIKNLYQSHKEFQGEGDIGITYWGEYRTTAWSKYRSLKDNLDREAIREYWEERAQNDDEKKNLIIYGERNEKASWI